MNAEIITIGDEILIGQIVDTNSAWIAKQLNDLGIKIEKITSISDSEEEILNTVDQSINRSDVVIITGGLGPTNDDITKTTLCKYFGGELVQHRETLRRIENLFAKRGLPITATNANQALVPSTCEVIENRYGTAPGMLFKKDNTIVISLPGVPFEMIGIMEDSVIPMLKKQNANNLIIHRVINTFGVPESFLSDKLATFEMNLPKHIKLAYLPSPSGIKLRLSNYNGNNIDSKNEINQYVNILKQEIPDNIFGYGNTSLPEVIGQMLKSLGATVSTAESCTGGNVSHLITSIAGSSIYYKGSVIAYSNEVKERMLNVDGKTLNLCGAVSREVVELMSKNVLQILGTTYSIAISGIAGPDGGTEQKPVGLVWIAVASEKQVVSRKYAFGNQRLINIERASYSALNLLRELILLENPEIKENIFGEKFD